jgi:hypothetical protein
MPDLQFVKNYGIVKARSNSFEITLELNDQKILLWSGHKLKPRKAKWPEPNFILAELRKHL